MELWNAESSAGKCDDKRNAPASAGKCDGFEV